MGLNKGEEKKRRRKKGKKERNHQTELRAILTVSSMGTSDVSKKQNKQQPQTEVLEMCQHLLEWHSHALDSKDVRRVSLLHRSSRHCGKLYGSTVGVFSGNYRSSLLFGGGGEVVIAFIFIVNLWGRCNFWGVGNITFRYETRLRLEIECGEQTNSLIRSSRIFTRRTTFCSTILSR